MASQASKRVKLSVTEKEPRSGDPAPQSIKPVTEFAPARSTVRGNDATTFSGSFPSATRPINRPVAPPPINELHEYYMNLYGGLSTQHMGQPPLVQQRPGHHAASPSNYAPTPYPPSNAAPSMARHSTTSANMTLAGVSSNHPPSYYSTAMYAPTTQTRHHQTPNYQPLQDTILNGLARPSSARRQQNAYREIFHDLHLDKNQPPTTAIRPELAQQDELQKLKDRLTRRTTQRDDLEQDYEAFKVLVQAKHQDNMAKYQILKGKYDDKDAENQALRAKYDDVTAENQGLKGEYEDKVTEIETLKGRYEAMEAELASLKIRKQELESKQEADEAFDALEESFRNKPLDPIPTTLNDTDLIIRRDVTLKIIVFRLDKKGEWIHVKHFSLGSSRVARKKLIMNQVGDRMKASLAKLGKFSSTLMIGNAVTDDNGKWEVAEDLEWERYVRAVETGKFVDDRMWEVRPSYMKQRYGDMEHGGEQGKHEEGRLRDTIYGCVVALYIPTAMQKDEKQAALDKWLQINYKPDRKLWG
jgi:hypothetical protein